MDEKDKRELQQTLAYLEVVNSQIESLSSQLELLEMSYGEHRQALETVQNMLKHEPGEEILLPIGANNYVYAQITDAKNVFFNIGTNISAKLPAGDAIEKLEGRLEEIETTSQKISNNLSGLKQQAKQLSTRGKQLYQQLQTEEGPGNVQQTP